MWAICRKFNILPNDPQFLSLTPIQMLWTLENIRQDNDEQDEALRTMHNPNAVRTTVATDDDEFEKFVRKNAPKRT